MTVSTDWQEVRLGDLGTFSKGAGIKKDQVLSEGFPCIRYGQIYTDHDSWVKKINTFVSKEVAHLSRQLQKGEILFAGSGETKAEIGKCVAFIGDGHTVAGGDIVILTPARDDSKFLGYALNAPYVAAQKMSRAQGDAVVHISASSLSSVILLLPPLKEQMAIAEALSDVDALIDSLEELLIKKQKIKTGVMQELLTGHTRLPGFTGDWQEFRLGEFAEIVMGQSPDSRYYNLDGHGLPLIQGNADIKSRKSIARVWTSASSKKAKMGDVLLTVRAPVGVAATASQDVCLGRGVCALSPISGDITFLFHSLVRNESKWRVLEQGSTFTAANSKQIADFLIDTPQDLEEQQAIAKVLSDIDDEIDALEKRLAKTRDLKLGMAQELLTGRTRLV